MSTIWIIGALILILTPIVLVHELGHFTAARLCRIRVEEFGLGLPPRAKKLFTIGDTVYSLNWFPIGGFVRPAGENDPSIAGGLAGAHWAARLFVLAAGASANFLFAFLLLWFAFFQGPTATQVVEIISGSPAEAAGVMPDDILLAINEDEITSPRILLDHVRGDVEKTHTLLILRDGEELEVMITAVNALGVDVTNTQARGYLRRNPDVAARAALQFLVQLVQETVQAPTKVAQGELAASDVRPVGIVGLGQIAGRAATNASRTSNLYPALLMAGLISGALGLTQLLPLPALDGGRIVFVLIEAITGRRVKVGVETAVHRYGMYFLLVLMVVLIFSDLLNPLF